MSPPYHSAEKKGIDRVSTVTAAEAASAAVGPSEEAMCLMALCLLGPSGVTPVPNIRILVPTPQVIHPVVYPFQTPPAGFLHAPVPHSEPLGPRVDAHATGFWDFASYDRSLWSPHPTVGFLPQLA